MNSPLKNVTYHRPENATLLTVNHTSDNWQDGRICCSSLLAGKDKPEGGFVQHIDHQWKTNPNINPLISPYPEQGKTIYSSTMSRALDLQPNVARFNSHSRHHCVMTRGYVVHNHMPLSPCCTILYWPNAVKVCGLGEHVTAAGLAEAVADYLQVNVFCHQQDICLGPQPAPKPLQLYRVCKYLYF